MSDGLHIRYDIYKSSFSPPTIRDSRWVGIKESGCSKPALFDSGCPRKGLLSPGIVYTIEGTDTNRTLMQNLDQYLVTNRLHVRIYSVTCFHASYLHQYVVLLLRIRLPKSKGIASVYFRFAYIAVFQYRQIS